MSDRRQDPCAVRPSEEERKATSEVPLPKRPKLTLPKTRRQRWWLVAILLGLITVRIVVWLLALSL